MKKLALFTTLLVLAACVSGAAFEAEEEAPLEIIDTYEEVDGRLLATPDDFSKGIETKSSQGFFSIRKSNSGSPNRIVSTTLTINFSPMDRIKLVQIVTELPGNVSIVGGGLGSNYFTVRVQSQLGGGYDFTVKINF